MKKIMYIALGVIFSLVIVLFITVQLFFSNEQRNIEMYPYTVKKVYDDFEIRDYESTLFSTVKLSEGEYEKASGNGFSILAGYIFGDNERNESIAMTSPVAMSLEDSMTMMFMVPKQYTLETLPKPNQTGINFQQEPAKTVAAITFGGWSDNEKIEQHKDRLVAALDAEGLTYSDRFYFLGYNPPFEVFNRRNEVIVELK
ncbi:MAG: heme-binding protein [Bacteroidota bacterium]